MWLELHSDAWMDNLPFFSKVEDLYVYARTWFHSCKDCIVSTFAFHWYQLPSL
jgi:hypothetical protein